jgi:hypothetical protein
MKAGNSRLLLFSAGMELPFTRVQFLQVFAEYNERIWPLQLFAAALGFLALALLFSRKRWADRGIAGILTLLWAFMGVGYHWSFFSSTNPAAYFFGGLFLVAASIFLVEGIVRNRIRFELPKGMRGWLAFALIAYALVVYPILGLVKTHPYPETPLFGVAPCPTTIFTLGMLLAAAHPRPLLLGAVPLAWAMIGGSAAFLLHVPQDLGLFVAGLAWIGGWIRQCKAPDVPMAG